MSKSSNTANNDAAKPTASNNSSVKPTVTRPISNTNVNMEYRSGTPSFTKKGK